MSTSKQFIAWRNKEETLEPPIHSKPINLNTRCPTNCGFRAWQKVDAGWRKSEKLKANVHCGIFLYFSFTYTHLDSYLKATKNIKLTHNFPSLDLCIYNELSAVITLYVHLNLLNWLPCNHISVMFWYHAECYCVLLLSSIGHTCYSLICCPQLWCLHH